MLHVIFLFLLCVCSMHIPINLVLKSDDFIVDPSLFPSYNSSWNEKMNMYAGHIPVTESDNTSVILDADDESSLFFWSFKKPQANDEHNRPLIIWLNGGPGCSSMDGALMEVGPLRVVDSQTLKWNTGWFEVGDLLFIDQPIGTGFSIKNQLDRYDQNLVDSTNHLFDFLKNYFKIFTSDFDKYDNFIIAGESYAGQYIPHLANKLLQSDKFKGKLSTVMLGNAWLDPNLQSLSYIPFLLENNMIDMSNEKDAKNLSYMLKNQDQCQNLNSEKQTEFVSGTCDMLLLDYLKLFKHRNKETKQSECTNIYDIKKTDLYPSCGNNWPEILSDSTMYLNIDNVKTSLNLNSDVNWKECNNLVHSNFNPKVDDKNGAELLTHLLDSGIKVNLFSGTNDLICNYLSTEMVIRHHLSDYLLANGYEIENETQKRDTQKFKMDKIWFHDNENVGTFWQRGNLTYVKINDASHMVAYDKSIESIGLIALSMRDFQDMNKTDTEIFTFTPLTNKDELNEEQTQNSPLPVEQTTDSDESLEDIPKTHYIKYILIFIILILALLVIYNVYKLWDSRKKPRYSSIAGAPTSRRNNASGAIYWVSRENKENRKKKVRWVDLEDMLPSVDREESADGVVGGSSPPEETIELQEL